MTSQGSRRPEQLDPPVDTPAALASTEEPSEQVPVSRLDELLRHVAQPTLPALERPFMMPPEPAPPALRTARVARMVEGGAEITMRGADQPVVAVLDEGVDRELIARALEGGEAVLVETSPGQDPVVVGVVQTRVPQKVELKAKEIILDAEREVVIRAGRASVRMREDGDVEVIGSRILTMSRGLFRIVGRMLRLN
jgi:hypothetical protein